MANYKPMMTPHYFIYGVAGLLIEIFWTGMGSLLSGNYALTGHTYLWMFFIYGLAVFLEPIHDFIRSKSIFIRGLIWVALIYFIEFSTGILLKLLIGYCPWDYSNATPLTIWGLIRFDYAPAWFIAGILFEKLHDRLDQIKITNSTNE